MGIRIFFLIVDLEFVHLEDELSIVDGSVALSGFWVHAWVLKHLGEGTGEFEDKFDGVFLDFLWVLFSLDITKVGIEVISVFIESNDDKLPLVWVRFFVDKFIGVLADELC